MSRLQFSKTGLPAVFVNCSSQHSIEEVNRMQCDVDYVRYVKYQLKKVIIGSSFNNLCGSALWRENRD